MALPTVRVGLFYQVRRTHIPADRAIEAIRGTRCRKSVPRFRRVADLLGISPSPLLKDRRSKNGQAAAIRSSSLSFGNRLQRGAHGQQEDRRPRHRSYTRRRGRFQSWLAGRCRDQTAGYWSIDDIIRVFRGWRTADRSARSPGKVSIDGFSLSRRRID